MDGFELVSKDGDFGKSNILDKELNKLYSSSKSFDEPYNSNEHIKHQKNIIRLIELGDKNYKLSEFISSYPCYNTEWRFHLQGTGCRLSSILTNFYFILYDYLTNNSDILKKYNPYIDIIILSTNLINIEREELKFKMPDEEFKAMINIMRKFIERGVYGKFKEFLQSKEYKTSEDYGKFVKPYSSFDASKFRLDATDPWEYKPSYVKNGYYLWKEEFEYEVMKIFDNINKLTNENTLTGGYYQKYLKYKNKYLNLKNKINY
jgi:hypothetical protein